MKTLFKLLKKLVKIAVGAFVLTFVIYFFNLDMKATAMLYPVLQKYYDGIERDKHL